MQLILEHLKKTDDCYFVIPINTETTGQCLHFRWKIQRLDPNSQEEKVPIQSIYPSISLSYKEQFIELSAIDSWKNTPLTDGLIKNNSHQYTTKDLSEEKNAPNKTFFDQLTEKIQNFASTLEMKSS